jgi:sugar/nucleoside kinase (ribokinase family)
MNKKPIVAIMYDFDKTLSVKDMQEYSFIPSLNMTAKDFWTKADELAYQNEMDYMLAYMLLTVQKAKEAGMKTSIDLVSENSDRYQIVVPCLPYVDNLIINEAEAGAITGIEATKETIPVIAKKLKELGVKERVIIHMPEMAYCYHDGVETTLSSYALPKGFIRGTTGAGDAFCAGALTAIYEELSDREVLERAQMAAVGALREADATSGVKSVEELKELVKDFSRQ